MARKPTISVIVPTLNEEQWLGQTLESVLIESVEVIVVDGGSQDATCMIAKEMGALVLHSEPGRGSQMNRGAEQATGDILLFVHADTQLPAHYGQVIRRCLAQQEVVIGAFRLNLTGQTRGLGLISWGANLRAKWLGLVYGDQGLFMTREMFQAVGGYPASPIMEDFILVQQLRKKGRIGLAAAEVKSSGRRWDTHGLWYPFLINQLVILGFFLGLSPDFLAKIYGFRKKV